jgi:hypothetical protein
MKYQKSFASSYLLTYFLSFSFFLSFYLQFFLKVVAFEAIFKLVNVFLKKKSVLEETYF